ncbi:Bax inhibitor-1 family protein [Superficieibacter electus]|nr:Bax inhibitor-1 family protein [Superficieibacter electus]
MNLLSVLRLNFGAFVPASMMIRIWCLIAAGMWAIIGIAWLMANCGINLDVKESRLWVASVAMLLIGGCWLSFTLEHLSTFAASITWLILITLLGVLSSSLFSMVGISTVFGTTGAMFAISALLGYCFNVNPGTGRQMLIMAACGMLVAVIVNSLLVSSTSVWITSLGSVVVWSFIAAHEKKALHGYARRLYSSEFSTLTHCTVLGALTIAFSAVAFFFRLILLFLGLIFGLIKAWL